MSATTSLSNGAPCWIDVMTSDADGARSFYTELLGWETTEPTEEFGGYTNFTRDGGMMAGCMAKQDPGMPDVWSVYLACDDIESTLARAKDHGAEIVVPAAPVGDLGVMGFLVDPSGAGVGVWQPGEHRGFAALGEPRTPSWFELHTRDHGAATAFYRDVFGLDVQVASDTDDFRYSRLGEPGGGEDDGLAGIMDASSMLPDGAPPFWRVYFGVDDTDATLAKAVELGGQVAMDAEDTPYGRLGLAVDPTGAQFALVAANEAMPAK